MTKPKRGEIWLVDFEPQIAEEIKKRRPAVVLSIHELRFLPVRAVVPVRGYKLKDQKKYYMVPLPEGVQNNLNKRSSVDCSQIKSFSIKRFIKKIGKVTEEEIDLISDTASYCIGR